MPLFFLLFAAVTTIATRKGRSPQPASQVKNQVVNPFTVDERVLIKVGPWFEQIFLPTLDSPIPQPEVVGLYISTLSLMTFIICMGP